MTGKAAQSDRSQDKRRPWVGTLLAISLSHGLLGIGYAQDITGSPTLQGNLSLLVEQAVATHPSVQAKQAELAGSGAGVDIAKWQYFPSLSAQTERNVNKSAANVGSTSTILRLQQPVWSGGRIESGVKSAQSKQQSAQFSVHETRVNIALRTVEAWQSLLIALGQQVAIDKLLVQLDRLNGMMTRRVEQQISPAIDMQLLRARLALAQSEQLGAKMAAETARQRLIQWVGPGALSLLPPSELIRSDVQSSLPAWSPDMEQRLESAVVHSPNLLRFEADMDAVREEIRQKQAELWPSVYARLDRQYTGNGIFGGKTADTSAYFGLQYTTGVGLTIQSQVQVAQAKVQSLESERETLRRQIKEIYETEWRDYQTQRSRIDYALLVQTSNESLFDSYSRLFVVGRRSWLELLNALREQNASDQGLADLLAQRQASHFRLKLYLGELPWQVVRLP